MFFYRIFLPENTNLKSLWLLPAITLLAIAHVSAAPLTFLSEQNPPVNYEDSRQKAAFTLAQNNKDGGAFSRMLVSMVADYTTFPITWSQAYTICQYNSISLRADLTGR
jgi:hypothetical protein